MFKIIDVKGEIMKIIKCEKCEYQIPTVMNVNCRVIRYDRVDNKDFVEVVCTLGVYCPTCGTETIFGIKHCFTKEFSNVPTSYLRDIALCESGVI